MAEPERREQFEEKSYWLDEKANVKKIIFTLYTICAALFIADAFYQKHVGVQIEGWWVEGWFGFYAVYGFIMCVGLVLGAKMLRVILMRDEHYYDRDR